MNLKEALKNKLTEKELKLLIRSFDVIGDLAIIKIPVELDNKEALIGETILLQHKNIKTVAKQTGVYTGEFRTIPLTIIAGYNRKETRYKEHGVHFILNPEKVYFSVRLSTERIRIAQLVKTEETVLVLFSGIGAFPLVIAKNSTAETIVGIEKNPTAHAYAQKSMALNKQINNVTLLSGDIVHLLPHLNTQFDRVLMPLPKTGILFLNQALTMVKPGGHLHYYDFQHFESFNDTVDQVETICLKNGRKINNIDIVTCGHCGTRLNRICLDITFK